MASSENTRFITEKSRLITAARDIIFGWLDGLFVSSMTLGEVSLLGLVKNSSPHGEDRLPGEDERLCLSNDSPEQFFQPALSRSLNSGTLNCANTRIASAATLTTGDRLPF